MRVKENLRNVKLELKDSYIKSTFLYEGVVHVKLTEVGLEYIKALCGEVSDTDFHYIITKEDVIE